MRGLIGIAGGILLHSAALAQTPSSVTLSAPGLTVVTTPAPTTPTSTPIPSGAAVLADAFYVSPSGSDSNDGSLATPFATIARCQTAMRADATKKTCYIRAGTYTYTTSVGSMYGNPFAIIMTTADSGTTLSYYPPDGYGSAKITGAGGTVDGGVGLSGANITVNGLDVGFFRRFAIASSNTNNTIKNNTLHDTTLVASNGTLFLNGNVKNNVAANNYVYNSANNGIVAQPSAAGNLDGVVIRNNFVENSASNCSDCGAIYTQEVTPPIAGTSIVTILKNYIRDVAKNMPSPGSKGIYLDDGASEHVVTGNVVEPGAKGWACFHVHGGENNAIRSNICDQAGSPDIRTVFYQTSGVPNGNRMVGNVFRNNIVTTGSNQGGGYTLDGSPANKLAVSNNDYFGYGSATPRNTGAGAVNGVDGNPANVNPNFTCGWSYTLPTNSPVYSAPTNHPMQIDGWGTPGFWGPPGFVIPRTGTPPSPPC